jgi:hypothetical protein
MLLGAGGADDQSVTTAQIDAVWVPWSLMNQTLGQTWSASIAAAASPAPAPGREPSQAVRLAR